VLTSDKGVVLANGINPRYGLLDPYYMALAVVDEALRQIVAVGGNRSRTAILDNFCWGNPENPERLGELVRASRGCYDAAKAFETPFISGKDSFYNEYAVPDGTIAIPPTLLISAISVMDDVKTVVSMDFKEANHFVYLVGATRAELGGSFYWLRRGALGSSVPKVDLETAPVLMDKVSAAIRAGLVRACHDCSEGGIGVTLSEMAFSGEIGAEIDLGHVPTEHRQMRSDEILFSESPTRWVCEVAPAHQKDFESLMSGLPFSLIGQTATTQRLRVRGLSGALVVDLPLETLKSAWQTTLREV
jgi:phosphoribosylformylglycinamidine synthase